MILEIVFLVRIPTDSLSGYSSSIDKKVRKRVLDAIFFFSRGIVVIGSTVRSPYNLFWCKMLILDGVEKIPHFFPFPKNWRQYE